MKTEKAITCEQKKRLKARMKRYKAYYLMLIPIIACVIIFSYIPMFGIIMAFQDYDILGGFFASKWVGFDNFIQIVTIPKFVDAIKNTLYIGVITWIFGTPLPILLAVMMHEIVNKKFRGFVQTVTYLPHFVSWVAIAGIFQTVFANEGTYNMIMKMIFGAGYEPTNILMNVKHFWGIIFWTNQWKEIGWNSMIFFAAIAGIDTTQYEAAKIDGCGKIRQIFSITLPNILPTLAIVLIMSTAGFLSANFEQILNFQNVYTQSQTEVIQTLTYREGILQANYSMAIAFGFAASMVTFLFMIISNRISKKVSDIGIW